MEGLTLTGKFGVFLLFFVYFGIPSSGFDIKEFASEAEGSLDVLDTILNSFQGDETCEYKCPNEGDIKKPRPGHKPSSNGCGSFGIKLEARSLPEMTTCCDEHDYCYDTCGNTRAECDDRFELCLYDMCEAKKDKFTKDQHEGCKMAAELMSSTTNSLGCSSYLTSQKQACQCQGDPIQYFDEEVKSRDILDVLESLDHYLDLDTKDEL